MRKPATRLRILAVALGGVLLMWSGPADVALAHEFDVASTLSLQASKKKVKKGKKVTFSGKVTSSENDCLGGREVAVVGLTVKTTTTAADGSYSVVIRIKKTSSWVATVAGSASGMHPHRHVCGGDISNSVRVRVKKP